MDVKFLANENFPLTSTKFLRGLGFDVLSIGENYSGIKDIEIMQIAIQENRTILTFDRDYGELIFKNIIKPPGGVMYLRFKEFSPLFPGQIINEIIMGEKFSVFNALTVIDRSGIRQRLYESPG
mgnify:CR=1 FL=1